MRSWFGDDCKSGKPTVVRPAASGKSKNFEGNAVQWRLFWPLRMVYVGVQKMMAGFVSKTRSWQRSLTVAFVLVAGGILATSAQAATVDFEALLDVGAPVVDQGGYYDVVGLTYTEAGFVFSNEQVTVAGDTAFRSLKLGSTQYTGSSSLYGVIPTGQNDGTVSLQTVSGNLFDISSIDFATLSPNGDAVVVTLKGTFGDDTTTSTDITVHGGNYNLETFDLTGLGLINLKKLELTGARPDNQFDNLVLTEITPVPVPAALPLFLSALAGLGIAGHRRRKRLG